MTEVTFVIRADPVAGEGRMRDRLFALHRTPMTRPGPAFQLARRTGTPSVTWSTRRCPPSPSKTIS